MITIATLYWDRQDGTDHFAGGYSPEWVERLYRGFRRNLTCDFRFVVFTDRFRDYEHDEIVQRLLKDDPPTYESCLQPYELNEPMILVGLDTIVTGNCDDLVEYCLGGDHIALPLDPYNPLKVCNGVALVPDGHAPVWTDRPDDLPPRTADMTRLRSLRLRHIIDDLFPGQVQSYKCQVKPRGNLGDARIVYFHGEEKPHQLPDVAWIGEHWR